MEQPQRTPARERTPAPGKRARRASPRRREERARGSRARRARPSTPGMRPPTGSLRSSRHPSRPPGLTSSR
jgi:hypothetical protein